MNLSPKVSIVCITYNQEQFIRQALESFVMQKTNFDFEVVIGEDCSIDKTREIIKEFEQAYPKIIRPIYREKNLGAIENFIDTLSKVKGEYVALCEGDDYFTDPLKLQKQVDFLEKNPDYSMCFHPGKVIYEDGSKSDEIYPYPEQRFNKDALGIDDLLKNNFIATNSVMYRWRFALEDINDIFPKNIIPGDWFLHMFHAQIGKIGFMDEIMSVYRRHPGGIWWESTKNMDSLHLKHGIQEFSFYENVYEIFTNKSKKYLEDKILPFGKYLINLFLDHREFKKLEEFSSVHSEYYDLIIHNDQQANLGNKAERLEAVSSIQGVDRKIYNPDEVVQQMKEIDNYMPKYNPNFINVKLSRDTVFVYTVRKSLQKAIDQNMQLFHGTVLDLGCGEMPYRQYMLDKNKNITKYIGVDIDSNQYHQSQEPDLFWDGRKINLRDGEANTVIATELFEHISNIKEVVVEINRVLSEGGLLFFTVPFVWPLHETPYDEYRYTPYSLERILTKAGFNGIVIAPLGGYNASLAQMLGIWIANNRGKSLSPFRRKLSEKFEKYILYPIIENLMKRDAKLNIKTYGENTMPTGFYGYAKK